MTDHAAPALLRQSIESLKSRFRAECGLPGKAWLMKLTNQPGLSPEANFGRLRGFDIGRCGVASLGRKRWASLPERLQPMSADAAWLVSQLPGELVKRLPPECFATTLRDGWPLWVAMVFGLAWRGVSGSPLRALQVVPLDDNSSIELGSVPYMKGYPWEYTDEQIAAVTTKGWYSKLDNFAVASIQAIDILQSWMADVPTRGAEANGEPPKPVERQTGTLAGGDGGGESEADGKPANGKKRGVDRTKEELFKSALRTHHKYETGGSVLNVEPVTTRQVEILTQMGISDTTAGRLLAKHFGTVEKYRDACFSGAIGPKLVVLLGDGLHAFGSFDSSERDVEDATDDGSDE